MYINYAQRVCFWQSKRSKKKQAHTHYIFLLTHSDHLLYKFTFVVNECARHKTGILTHWLVGESFDVTENQMWDIIEKEKKPAELIS